MLLLRQRPFVVDVAAAVGVDSATWAMVALGRLQYLLLEVTILGAPSANDQIISRAVRAFAAFRVPLASSVGPFPCEFDASFPVFSVEDAAV